MKKLIPLIVIVAVLVGLVYMRQKGVKPVTIVEQAKLSRLLPTDLSESSITKLEMYNGSKPDDKLVLTREEGSDKWRATSYFNAPIQADKIEKFLTELVNLKGEFRTAKADVELDAFELGEKKAFNVLGYGKEADKPLFHVLSGKAPDFRTVFMRTQDGKDIFVEAVNLRSNAGFRADDADAAGGTVSATSPATSWVDKKVVDLDKDKIRKIALVTPDKKVTFEAKQKPAPEPKPEEEKKEGEPAAPTPPIPPATPEFEWAVAEGGPGSAHKQTGIDSLLRKLDTLTADDVVDPAKKAEYGLEQPAFRCAVTIEGQPDEVVIEGGRPKPDDAGYVRLAGAKEEFIFKLSKYNFDQLFPKGADLFDLQSYQADKNAVDKIEITQPEGRLVLAKQDGKWIVVEPVCDLSVQTPTLDTIASTLATWKPSDYADGDATGLEAPTRTVVFTAGAEVTHTIALGADAKGFDGVYAKLDGAATTLAMSRTDLKKVFIAPKDAFERQLLDIVEDDIIGIRVERGADGFELKKAEDKWSLSVGDQVVPAKQDAVDALTSKAASIQADNILFGRPEIEGEASATVRLTTATGEHVIVFGPDMENSKQAKVDAKSQIFTIAHDDAVALLPASETLRDVVPPAPEPTAAAPSETPAPLPTETPAAPSQEVTIPVPVAPAAPEQAPIEIPSAPADQNAQPTLPVETPPAPTPEPSADQTTPPPAPEQPAPVAPPADQAPVAPPPAPAQAEPAPTPSAEPPAAGAVEIPLQPTPAPAG